MMKLCQGMLTENIADCFDISIGLANDIITTWVKAASAVLEPLICGHNTAKLLLRVAPKSSIIFISKGCGGSISDKELANCSDYLDLVLMSSIQIGGIRTYLPPGVLWLWGYYYIFPPGVFWAWRY